MKTIDQLKDEMMDNDESNKPFLVTNDKGEEFQAYWLDIYMGLTMVPEINEKGFISTHTLRSLPGLQYRQLRDDEKVDERVAGALRLRNPTMKIR